MSKKPWTNGISQILEPADFETLWFFRLKGTNLYYHRVNDKFDFLPGLNGACMFDKKGCEQLQYMQATGETELVLASEVITQKCEK